MVKRILSLAALLVAAFAVAVPLGMCHGHSLLWLFGGGMGLAGAIVATPVETLNTVDATNVYLTKKSSAGSGGPSPGVSIVAKAFTWLPHTSRR